MMNWLKVDVNDLNKEVMDQLHGVTVKMSFSPYDVPRLFCGYKDPQSGVFTIEFKYLTDEQTVPHKSSPDAPIELEVGINSKRVYKIKLDVKKLGCKAVRFETLLLAEGVVGEMEKFRKSVPERLQGRYEMPESIVFKKRDEIFSEIAG